MNNRNTPQRLDHSFEVIPHAVIFHSDLSDGAKVLYMILSKYANQEGACWPSRTTLARDQGKSRDSIDRYIKELAAAGALLIHPQHRTDGSQTSNLYTVIKALPNEGGADMRLGGSEDAAQNTTHKNTTQLDGPSSVDDPPSISVTPASARVTRSRSARPTKTDPTRTTSDPISDDFARSQLRRNLLDRVQGAAVSSDTDDLEAALDDAFDATDAITHLVLERGWKPPQKAVSRYEAGKWLNKFLWALADELGHPPQIVPTD